MNHEETILRLQQTGILSKEQAALLIQSLEHPVPSGPTGKKPKNYRPLVLLISGLILLALVIFGSGSTEPVEIQTVSETINQPGEVGRMSENLSKIMALFLFLVIPAVVFVWLHNKLTEEEEQTLKAWAQVESNYQRRSDLIPNLVKTISKYMQHEADTLHKVTAERGNEWQSAIDELVTAQGEGAELLTGAEGAIPDDETYLNSLQEAQNQIGLRMHRLIATVENYPALRSSDQMMGLLAQLEGTENRINIARIQFNEAVVDFNASTRKIPGSLIASLGSFKRKAYFKAVAGSDKVVNVGFD